MTDQGRGVLLTTIGVLAIVPDSILIRLIDADILVIAFWRSSLAGVVLFLAVGIQHRSQTFRAIAQLKWSGAIYTALTALATLLFVVAIETTTVASTLFIVSTTPVFCAILGWFVLRETVSRRMVWTILLAIVGMGVIIGGPACWTISCRCRRSGRAWRRVGACRSAIRLRAEQGDSRWSLPLLHRNCFSLLFFWS